MWFSPHMVRTTTLPVIRNTGHVRVLRTVRYVALLYHELILSHTCLLTLSCTRFVRYVRSISQRDVPFHMHYIVWRTDTS